MLQGSVAFFCNGTTSNCLAGSFIFVPRGAAHGFSNPAPEPARILVVTSPGAIQLVETVYQELDRASKLNPAAMATIHTRFDSEILLQSEPG